MQRSPSWTSKCAPFAYINVMNVNGAGNLSHRTSELGSRMPPGIFKTCPQLRKLSEQN